MKAAGTPFALAVLTVTLVAQMANASEPEAAVASVEGLVTVASPQGQAAVVPGALVKLTASEASETLSVTTDLDGRYRVSNLSPGSYTIESTWMA